MAKFIPSPLVSEIRGSVSDTTFKRSQAGNIITKRQRSTLPATSLQLYLRSVNAGLKRGWSALTSVQQNSWNQLALTIQANELLNGQYPKRGYDLFLEYNWRNAVGLAPFISVAPNTYIKTIKNQGNTLFGTLATTPNCSLGFTFVTPSAGMIIYVWIQFGMRGPQKSAMSPWRFLGATNVASGVVNLTSAYNLVFPAPVLGQLYRFKFFYQSDGAFPNHHIDQFRTVLV